MTIERNTGDYFVGRENALNFFRASILEPQQPAYHIISIDGEAGVGKTTLLNRLKSMADSPEFNRYCLTGIVDGTQTALNSIGVMEQFANQFKAAKLPLKEFEKEFENYVEEQYKITVKPETASATVMQEVKNVADAAAGMLGAPGQLAKGVAETGVDLAGIFFEKKMEEHRRLQEANRLYDQIDDLTRAFVDDLDRLAENRSLLGSVWIRHPRRVILFIDAFDRLADDLGPWLLKHFLKTIIDERRVFASNYVVVVVTSRFPIQKTAKTIDLESWLCYSQISKSLSLTRFTYDETKRYLDKQGICDPPTVDVLWQKSHGLPFYLSLVKPDPQGNVDPTEDVVNIYLNSISLLEKEKRHFALVAALMSRPFNQDDLSAFPFLSQDTSSLYAWLIDQSFVYRTPDGRYTYLDLAQEFFSRYLYRTSEDDYNSARENLMSYYRDALAQVEQEKGVEAYNTAQWLELLEAFVCQLFFLPKPERYIEAMRYIVSAYVYVKQPDAVARVLTDLSKVQFHDPLSPAPQIISHLLVSIKSDIASQAFIDAHTYLLHLLDSVSDAQFPKTLLAHIYYRRSLAYCALHQYWLALADLNRSIELNPHDAPAITQRGLIHLWLKDLDAAKADYAASLKLAPDNHYNLWMIEWVGMCQEQGQSGNEADSTGSADINRERASRLEKISASSTASALVSACQGVALLLRQNYEQALNVLEQALAQQQVQAQNPYAWSFPFWKGIACAYLRRDDEAIDALKQALVLGLPLVLLAPLHWLEADRPDFYQKYTQPMI